MRLIIIYCVSDVAIVQQKQRIPLPELSQSLTQTGMLARVQLCVLADRFCLLLEMSKMAFVLFIAPLLSRFAENFVIATLDAPKTLNQCNLNTAIALENI